MEWKLSARILGEKKLNCPNCKNKSIAEILWGYYEDTDVLKERLEKKEIVLGGCMITEHDPRWECNVCNHTWGERED